jgi:RNA polymerase sigma-70 factor (ECF subfamily)
MSLTELTDDELIVECRRRSDRTRGEVVDVLFGRHYERVARWAFRFTNDRDAAADLAQEVFLKAHRHLSDFKGTSRFSTWLYSIVRHESLNWLRRAGPPPEDEAVLADVAALGPNPEAIAADHSRAARLREFLAATLDETERRVFTLHYGDEMTLDAVTRMLRLDNPSGAKAYIMSARRKLPRAVGRLRARGEAL